MTVTQMRSQAPVELPKAPAVDLNLEVVVIPVFRRRPRKELLRRPRLEIGCRLCLGR